MPSKIKHTDRAPITKEMRKHLEMMKVAVKFEDAEAFTQHDIQFHEAMITHPTINIYKHSGFI